MRVLETLRTSAIAGLSVLAASPGPIGGALAAAPGEALDGEPTAAACARFGFRGSDEDDSPRLLSAPPLQPRGSAYAAVSPSVPAPPPPPPPPSMAARARANVVELTARRAPKAPMQAPSSMFLGPPAGSIDTERYPDAQINPVKRVAEAPVSTFSIDVDTASYANVRRFLMDGRKPPRDAVRVEELVNYFDYGYPLPRASDQPFAAFVADAPSPWSRGKRIIHIGLQGYDLPRGERPPLNLVFLVDVSGSMSDDDRLPLAVKALNLLVDQLRPQDRVSLVVYAGAAGVVLEPTSGAEKLKLRCGLQALHAGGSTAGGEGLALAYRMAEQHLDKRAVNRVILMTDGDFNVGVADPEKLQDFVAEKRKTGIYLSVYGYGRGNYNDVMMQTLSQTGNGTAAYVDSLDEARKLFREDFRRSVFPIADDVKVQVEFNPAKVSEYRLIGYETRLLNREDFNNDQVDAGEVGAGASVTALYEITPAGGPESSDPLRYGGPPPTAGAGRAADELAFLKIRYKLPGQAISRLIERPITEADAFATLEAAPESTRFALAVAAYGQRLRADPYMDDRFSWNDIARLAEGARGEDSLGLRGQFVGLARSAGTTRSLNE